jgi:ATP-binding cassette subfamily B protein
MKGALYLLGLAWRTDRGRLVKSGLLLLGSYGATPLIGILLRDFTDAVLSGGSDLRLTTLAVGIAAVLICELMLGHFAHLHYFELGEKAVGVVEADLLAVANGTPTITHLDTPTFADTLALAKQDAGMIRQSLESVLHLVGLLIRGGVTAVLLAQVNGWLVLLPLVAALPVLITREAQVLINWAKEKTAESVRRSSHLIALAADADAVKEIRLYGAQPHLMRRQAEDWSTATRRIWRAQWQGAALRAGGQLLFALAYGGAILLVVEDAVAGRATVGEVVLVVTLAVQIGLQVSAALSLLAAVQATSRTVERLDTLRTLAPRPTPHRAAPVAASGGPARLRRGIRLEGVTFTYPGATRRTLDGIDLTIPSGATIALVGENGAGKSTLVKLLCGLYSPTDGRITVDGEELDPAGWQSGVAMLFQDYARFNLRLRDNVGVGDLPRLDDDRALKRAAAEARAGTALARVPGGWDGALGRDYTDGAELSGGQWQSLGLARTLMRRHPLLLALDEPAAALDAQAEHALFERFAASAQGAQRSRGAITLFVSHRFSTVRMADLIVVLDGGRIAEIGTHDELMSRAGTYADLFTLQARIYQ